MDHAWLLYLLATVAAVRGFSENSVHIWPGQYGQQLITSSTLRWVSAEYGNRPESSVVASTEIIPNENNEAEATTPQRGMNPNSGNDEEPIPSVKKELAVYVCRARHNGLWIPGVLRSGQQQCKISLLGRVFPYERYEVLENVDNGARLSWVRWDRFNGLPAGAVAGGETYVARRHIEADGKDDNNNVIRMKHFVGKLDMNEGMGRITVIVMVDGQKESEQEFIDGEVLIETEPVSYELTGLKFNHWRKKVHRQPVKLGETILKNDASSEAVKVDTVIAYEANYSVYWGQGKALLKGLPTQVRLPNSTIREDIKWGIQDTEDRKEVARVEAFLEPGTAVNVTLHGNNTESEIPYTGKLVAVYADLQTRARAIHGSRREVAMRDITPIYGPVYWLHNNTLVPTTTTTTTTTTSTTSTSTTSTTTSTTQQPKKNEDNSVYQNDQGGAQSLKEKKQPVSDTSSSDTQSSSTSVHAVLFLTLISVVICRIT